MAQAELDPKFKDEVSRFPGGANIKRCFQCGTCTAGCPVREIDEEYNPRKIIRMVVLGMRERVLSSDFIWLCSQCYTCDERCPQGVRIKEVMEVLKNMAVKKGYVQEAFAKQAETIGKIGILYAISDAENRRRTELGLPKLPSQNLEVQDICRTMRLDKLLSRGGSV
nr:4Fe-4S dicluster domain-containing protein [Candidatus Njordarchaeota archaeon]